MTGATGFVGRRVLAELRRRGAEGVVCVAREPARLEGTVAPRWRVVAADVTEPERYAQWVEPGMPVLHLAAATGRAPAATHYRVNVQGTAALLQACAERGGGRFVYVSSIAATFRDRRHYAYAESKLEAERRVRVSGLDWVIVRPTMVLGPGSPVLAGLRTLATAPVVVQFGGGRVRVQPIHVDDLARLLVDVVTAPAGAVPQVLEAGGAEELELGELLRRLRERYRGSRGPVLRVPVEPLRSALAYAERIVRPRLPLTAGQLASFVNDGVAGGDAFVDARRSSFASVQAMLTNGEG